MWKTCYNNISIDKAFNCLVFFLIHPSNSILEFTLELIMELIGKGVELIFQMMLVQVLPKTLLVEIPLTDNYHNLNEPCRHEELMLI